MGNESKTSGYGISVFKPKTSSKVKRRQITFFVIFCVIILIQSCYWLFANSAKPFVLGMPFGMFFIVLFVIIEFMMLVALYVVESKNNAL